MREGRRGDEGGGGRAAAGTRQATPLTHSSTAAGDASAAEFNDGTVAPGLSDNRRRRGVAVLGSLSALLPSRRTLSATQVPAAIE